MNTGKLHKMPHCPSSTCGKPLDGYGHDEAVRPRPGDYCICIYCAAPLQYTDTLGLKLVDLEAFDDADRDTVEAMIRQVRAFHEYQRRIN